MPTTMPNQTIWQRWWHNVSSGWGNAPGAVLHGIEGSPTPPTVKSGAIQPGSPAAGTLSAAQGAVSAGEFLLNPNNWIRVGEIVAGVVLLTVGLDYMLKLGITQKAGAAVL